jgi:hypothetical protein
MHNGQARAAPSQGPPLGLEEDSDYVEGSLRLPGPAGLLLYTDGLTEARRDDSFFGIEGVSAVLGALDDPFPSEVIAVLRERTWPSSLRTEARAGRERNAERARKCGPSTRD